MKQAQVTMADRLLGLLTKKWVTPAIAYREVNCLSLSQRCGEYTKRGLPIQKRPVITDTGKRVMSYRIVKGC